MDTPILPAHIEETVQAIAKLHAAHRNRATPLQRVVEQMTAQTGRPRFIGLLTVALAVWIGANLALPVLHRSMFDPPPFVWLQALAQLVALYLTVLILTTQRRENELADLREQLTLDLTILGEQKSAKIISLLEELRRDSPMIADRHDPEAEAMSTPADPEAVLEALRVNHDDDPSETSALS